ncbi:MAG TPA: bifunctional DNA-binding transcriptional regulator/O6-methylguanine-DNA methyltransferase Ada [Candidatus Dormibacteraeota bacterium]|nr:bifunctional DNA-binding transcriptional regulator/O6-methylguanine-DNA methyltransferase Ada [Candidatus Dormibacteraeota bacterium]
MTTTTMDSIASSDGVSPPMTDEQRWVAVTSRDRAADGAFYYAVRTTGVYCRPSCGSRQARRENIAFHTTREEAEAAGFRPCRRCHPDQLGLEARRADAVARACRLIDEAEEEPSLDQLATSVGMSRFHFHRVFKEVTGVTPRAYAAARRGERVRRGLVAGGTVTDAVYGAGFNSSGRFYADSNDLLGMTPTAFKAGAPGVAIRFAVGQCSLGSILVASTDRGICSIMLGDDPDVLVAELQRRFARAELIGGDGEFERLVAQVVGFVEAPGHGLDLPLDVRGTAFQQRVWQALREIPTGSTATYGDIAERIGAPTARRAVAGACANNPVAVAIPCHRVVRKDGNLSGYRWGVERKRELLRREGAA